jgi:Tol biopolymer transport system component/DNA-binding winged helix-turn-helix (wHTH) protein
VRAIVLYALRSIESLFRRVPGAAEGGSCLKFGLTSMLQPLLSNKFRSHQAISSFGDLYAAASSSPVMHNGAEMSRYRFGPFDLDVDSSELRKHGTRVRIQKQPFQVLRSLVERANQLVTRDELRQTVWANDTFVDFEHGLNAAMNKVRQALNDASDHALYIETLPGQGYRFVAPVEKQDGRTIAGAELVPQSAAQLTSSPVSRMWITLAVASVLGGLALGVLGVRTRFAGSTPLRPLTRLRVELAPETKVTRSIGGGFLALSPDGTLLALIVQGTDGGTRLATRRLDQSQVTLLAGTEGAISPFFSPDGQWIGFNADRKVKKISVRGGVVVTLCDAAGWITGSWGDDGDIIAPLGWGTGLSRIPSAGGPPTPVTKVNAEKGEYRHGWPQVLPGSRAVVFSTEHTAQAFDDADIEVVSLKTGERTTLHHGGFFPRYLPSGHLIWIHQNAVYAAPFDLGRLVLTGEPQPVVDDIDSARDNGADLAFSQAGMFIYNSAQGELQRSIFWLDRSGKTQPLHPAPGFYGFPRFSPDGGRLAFTVGDGQGREDIWVQDLHRDTASRVTLLPGRNQSPVWTPDGTSLVFFSSNPAAPGIYSIRADGSGVAQRLTDGRTWQTPWSISADGKRLATTRMTTGIGVEVWTAPFEGDAQHPKLGEAQPFLERPFNTIQPAFSPDGRWLAYSATEPGKEGLWVVPFPGPGGAWLISNRGSDPIWSRNGRELFFLVDHRTVMFTSYTSSGDAFVSGTPQVWSQRPLLDVGSPPVGTFDLAQDGKRLAVVLNTDGTADPTPITHLTFLLNFFDDLRRRIPADGK